MKKTDLVKIIKEEFAKMGLEAVAKSLQRENETVKETPNTSLKEIAKKLKEDTEYQAKFRAALKKFGVKSPKELSGDKEKEFYDYVDASHDAGENETD